MRTEEARRPPKIGSPPQAVPLTRGLFAGGVSRTSPTGPGVHPAQDNSCENLTGLAQQMCYAVLYGI